MDAFSLPNKQQDYPEAQGLVLAVLTCAPTVYWNLNNQQNAEITMTQSVTFATPIGIRKGRLYALEVIQSGAGSFLITWSSAFKNVSGLTLQTTTGHSNFLTFKAISDTTLGLVGNYSSTRA
jgi:hypothetical protein